MAGIKFASVSRDLTTALSMMQAAEENVTFQRSSVPLHRPEAACLPRVSTCDSRPLVSDALGLRDCVCFCSDYITSEPAVVLSPGTPVPHKIQTPNVTLAR